MVASDPARPAHRDRASSAVVLFVAISVLLARYLLTENAERNDILAVLQAQARRRRCP